MTEDAEFRSRRTVMLGVGLVGAAGALAACSSSSGSKSAAPASSAPANQPAQSSAPKSLASTSDIPVGGGKVFSDQKVVVTQPKQGEFEAFSAVCTHMGCTVGEVADGTINCPCHGSKYSIVDAHVVHGPAPKPLTRKKVTVTGNEINVT